MNAVSAQEFAIDYIKGGPHAHGNLEALLNIAVGLTLGFLAVGTLFKQIISWCFILGTLFHSGLLYLERVFQLEWAGSLLGTGIGPVLLLVGLLLTGVAAATGGGRVIGLLQRVREAHVAVAGETVGAIGPGLLVLVGVERGDGEAQAEAPAPASPPPPTRTPAGACSSTC